MKALYLLIISIFLISCSTNNKPQPKTDYYNSNLYVPPINKESNLNLEKAFANVGNSNVKSFYSYRNDFLKMVNDIRAKGTYCAPPAPPLKYNQFLEKAAMAHAKDMALNNMLRHTGSGTDTDIAKKSFGVGSYFMERIIFFGYPAKVYNLVGENATLIKIKNKRQGNLKYLFKRALKMYIDDPPHCKILMNPRLKDMGLGVYKKGNKYYWIMDLGETE